jgi:signal peptidase II
MIKKYRPLLIYPLLIFALDQLAKFWILKNFYVGEIKPIIQGYFDLVLITNRGAAFGMFAELAEGKQNWFFLITTLIAFIILFAIYRKTKADEREIQIPLAVILGGALGNVWDRIRLGEVTDFLSFHWQNKIADFVLLGKHFRFPLTWPAFNIADAAITCGALYLVIKSVFFAHKRT